MNDTESTFWTAERIAELARLWPQGLSQAEIARRLSTPDAPCNKSMVKGKAVRLGLPDREPNLCRKTTPVDARPEPGISLGVAPETPGCRWPSWPHAADRSHPLYGTSCGAKRVLGKPYCHEHLRAAYVDPGPKRAEPAIEKRRAA